VTMSVTLPDGRTQEPSGRFQTIPKLEQEVEQQCARLSFPFWRWC
jgi:hypothetical protein